MPAEVNTVIELQCIEGYKPLGSTVLTCTTASQNVSNWQGEIDPLCVENDWKSSNESQFEQYDPMLQVIQLLLYEHRKTECSSKSLRVDFFVEENKEPSCTNMQVI